MPGFLQPLSASPETVFAALLASSPTIEVTAKPSSKGPKRIFM
jgi:hypothetical protein